MAEYEVSAWEAGEQVHSDMVAYEDLASTVDDLLQDYSEVRIRKF